MIHSVKNNQNYACCDYDNYPNPNFKLGEVLIKNKQIGVVIQTHNDEDCRTDTWGNCSPGVARSATLAEIKSYRPALLTELEAVNIES